jgi:outer membrane receptor for ferric coprogen and ferric-rhodotorulic acid
MKTSPIQSNVSTNARTPAPCPTSITFYAGVTVTGTGTITYHWEASDGTQSATQTAAFNYGNGVNPLIIGGANVPAYSVSVPTSGTYTATLHILTSRGDVISPSASYVFVCAG